MNHSEHITCSTRSENTWMRYAQYGYDLLQTRAGFAALLGGTGVSDLFPNDPLRERSEEANQSRSEEAYMAHTQECEPRTSTAPCCYTVHMALPAVKSSQVQSRATRCDAWQYTNLIRGLGRSRMTEHSCRRGGGSVKDSIHESLWAAACVPRGGRLMQEAARCEREAIG